VNLPAAEGARAVGLQLGEGREADVYAYGTDAMLKLYRPGFGGHQAEAAALRALDGHGAGRPVRRGQSDIAGRLLGCGEPGAVTEECADRWRGDGPMPGTELRTASSP